MSRVLLQSLLALLMAVPLHFCCWMGLMGNEEEGACMACHQFLSPEEMPLMPAPLKRHCECCDGTLQRSTSPDMLTVPRPLPVEQPPLVWSHVSKGFFPDQDILSGWQPRAEEHPPPWPAVPLYQRHCALLL